MKLKQSGHLTRYERGTLVSMRSSGKSFREIAKYLGINVSTVSREFKRNKLPVYLSAHSSIREKAFEILCEPEIPYEQRNERLTKLFTQNPTLIREDRKNPRHRRNWASLDFHRNRKKHLY